MQRSLTVPLSTTNAHCRLHRLVDGSSVDAVPRIAALGMFDGLHLGHQLILEKVRQLRAEYSPEARTALISFYPHPLKVLNAKWSGLQPSILTLHQKLKLLSESGIDELWLLHFTEELAGMSAECFIEEVLLRRLGVRRLLLGADAKFGAGQRGTVELASRLMSSRGAECISIDLLQAGSRRIGSSRIREQLAVGDLKGAAELLGRPYAIEGRVVKGDGRGAQLGFRTANLAIGRQAWPPFAVYASLSHLAGRTYESISSIGTRPTFGKLVPCAETHLLSYSGPAFYGRRLEVELVERIRGERRFAGVSELISQIKLDVAEARKILG